MYHPRRGTSLPSPIYRRSRLPLITPKSLITGFIRLYNVSISISICLEVEILGHCSESYPRVYSRAMLVADLAIDSLEYLSAGSTISSPSNQPVTLSLTNFFLYLCDFAGVWGMGMHIKRHDDFREHVVCRS